MKEIQYCNWKLYKNDGSWKSDCGITQGIKVRPKQKTCFCGKRINRIYLEEENPIEKKFWENMKEFER